MDNRSSKLEYFVVCVLLMAVVGTGVLFILHKRDNKVEELNNNNSNNGEVEPIKKDPEINDPNVQDNDLDFAFLKNDYKKNNVIYSPLSIREALFLVQEGADGDTLNQLKEVLDKYRRYTIKNVDKKIGISNAIFINDVFKDAIEPAYVNSLKSGHSADVFYDDMSSPINVNNYVKEKTFDMIPELFDDISGSKIVLVNALAIDLNWKYPFDPLNTYDREFNGNKDKLIPTMYDEFRHVADIKYYVDEKLTLLSLPLEKINETELEYIVVMPDNLDEYISKVNDKVIVEDLNKLIGAKKDVLAVHMPKYKFDFEIKLLEGLINLGVKDMFAAELANFNKISKVDLYISKAKHKAHIEVSEDGVKAAAATGFAFAESALIEEEKPVIININKPHMVIIRDKNTQDIWFVGSIYNP